VVTSVATALKVTDVQEETMKQFPVLFLVVRVDRLARADRTIFQMKRTRRFRIFCEKIVINTVGRFIYFWSKVTTLEFALHLWET
jgi:hypothetical protein